VAGTWRRGSAIFPVIPVVILSLATLTACGIPYSPSPELSGYSLVVAEALALSDSLDSLEWDFHVAVQRNDDAEARTTANAAVPLIEAFLDGPLQTQTDRCLEEAQAAAGELLSLQLSQWRAWSDGRDYPDRDEISLFFAFFGSDKAWELLLDDADERCRQAA